MYYSRLVPLINNMKIQLKDKLKNLNNTDSSLSIGEALSNIVIASETGGKMKLFVLGKDLYSKEEIDLDESDIVLVKQAIEASKGYTALVTGQLLLLLENIK